MTEPVPGVGALIVPHGDESDRDVHLIAQARAIRRHVVVMSGHARTGHLGSALSAVDLLTALYFRALRVDPMNPMSSERDRFILSKGHAAAALYAVLAARGFLPTHALWSYLADDSPLTAHVVTRVPGVDLSTGSLGHGLPVGVGLAFAAQRARAPWRTFVMLSDGECDEGSTWESALAAGNLGLDALTVIVDHNKLQALGTIRDVLDLAPFATKWESFGWSVAEIDGHDMSAIDAALERLPFRSGRPSVLIAHTVSGKGVSFMENRVEWHYLTPTVDQVTQALQELA